MNWVAGAPGSHQGGASEFNAESNLAVGQAQHRQDGVRLQASQKEGSTWIIEAGTLPSSINYIQILQVKLQSYLILHFLMSKVRHLFKCVLGSMCDA